MQKKRLGLGKAFLIFFGSMILIRLLGGLAFGTESDVEECKDDAMIVYIEDARDCKDRLNPGIIRDQCIKQAVKEYRAEAQLCEDALLDLEECNSVLFDCD